MTTAPPDDIVASVSALLARIGMDAPSDGESEVRSGAVAPLKGDGSNRRFWRVTLPGSRRAIIVAPEKQEERCLREAGSVWKIGRHLRSVGVPVPELYGFAEESGVLLCEDLGDVQLHSIACSTDFADEEAVGRLRGLYRQTLDVLVTMQIRGAENFDSGWCWDTPRYDRELMLARESGYFLSAFWQGSLGQQVPEGLSAEFASLADVASEAPASFFLHRDFQSRNIMIKDSRVRIIDFQGGRLGPLGYDLASLLLDPYAALPPWFQEELYDYYTQRLQQEAAIDLHQFHRCYPALALQRNLQILGAFSYLSTVSGKPFFRGYIAPALDSLLCLARRSRQPSLPVLVAVVERARLLMTKIQASFSGR